ncbi:MAG: DUF6265 family protein [Bacteroidia bacterium]
MYPKNSFKILIILASSHIIGCYPAENNSDNDASFNKKNLLMNAEWMIGVWQNKTDERTFSESWVRINDTTMRATTYFIEGKDTISSELINLIQRNNELYYEVAVSKQNEGQSVPFKLTFSSMDSLIFEKPNHDFPQKICYYKISDDSLVAKISGTFNGKYSSEKFPMGRLD